MKYFAAAALAALLFVSPANASSVTSACNGTQTMSEFVGSMIDVFAAEGIKIDPVTMVRPQLDAFIKSLMVDIENNGYDPTGFEVQAAAWETLVWAKLTGPQGQEAVGIAVFDKNGCLLESSTWPIDKFFETMKRAFGADA